MTSIMYSPSYSEFDDESMATDAAVAQSIATDATVAPDRTLAHGHMHKQQTRESASVKSVATDATVAPDRTHKQRHGHRRCHSGSSSSVMRHMNEKRESQSNQSIATDATVAPERTQKHGHRRSQSHSSFVSRFMNQKKESPTSVTPPTTPQRKYLQIEKRLFQFNDITRTIFACSSPCQISSEGGKSKITPRPGMGSYYLPDDILDDEDVYEYCGVEAVMGDDVTGLAAVQRDFVTALNQDYDMSRV
mmetsp:Transcript_22090/g.28580  ORF Transcript_22090/g.28580 Transcript_22090/m.28580 type:complete len:248 (+) Transcript_22090:82-825(+)|eukprot:CAMPEP_0198144142 /NCGR_PEP_ID=MMETSP1443-20131203/13543_1 /TAXON_ID=186043 /ORGANISM="Entomoneis sp., Strain CCMP2396" /LENGTH=247 /DNA_ID=CAMNT_0043807491 /DNA_START=11 /DNA_END=754 /DNA_ORIENTATION=-